MQDSDQQPPQKDDVSQRSHAVEEILVMLAGLAAQEGRPSSPLTGGPELSEIEGHLAMLRRINVSLQRAAPDSVADNGLALAGVAATLEILSRYFD